ncbi:GtrA family protein [Ktedonobacteria bacterium brp13]|nr:GtrA family protein [Ktedonobacteria bacterium brp13]
MIETEEAHSAQQEAKTIGNVISLHTRWRTHFQQVVRFSLVGGVNTGLDLLALNALLLLLPTNKVWLILAYNVLAYSFGAFNSFLLNKYWTFHNKQSMSWREFTRFALTTLFGMAVNTTLVWVIRTFPHPFVQSMILWTNISKILAIMVSAFISYLGMRLWVFVQKP